MALDRRVQRYPLPRTSRPAFSQDSETWMGPLFSQRQQNLMQLSDANVPSEKSGAFDKHGDNHEEYVPLYWL